VRAAGEVQGQRSAQFARLEGREGDVLRWDPVLGAGPAITGRAEDELGRPLAGWTVRAEPQDLTILHLSDVVTDAGGRFTLAGLLVEPHRLVLYGPDDPGRLRAQLRGILPEQGEVVLQARDETRGSTFVSGRLTFRGTPVTVARISASSHSVDTRYHEAEVDGEGRFRMGPLPPGSCVLQVQIPGGPHGELVRLDLEPQEERDLGELELPVAGRVELLLRRTDGVQLEQPLALLIGPGGAPHVAASEDGRTFTTREVFRGPYRLVVTSTNAYLPPREIHVPAGETLRLELALEPGSKRWLIFRVPDDAVIPRRLGLVVRDGSGRLLVDQDCSFTAQGFALSAAFPPGRFTFEARTPDGEDDLRADGTFQVERLEGTAAALTLDLAPPDSGARRLR
jgi:hypothetical protein